MEGVQIQVNAEFFFVDLFVLPLAGFNIILGVKWLRKSGLILWDFNALTMTLHLNGKQDT